MKSNYWMIGIGAGALTGLLVAAVMTFMDWRLNPGGIFHDGERTDWIFVAETAVSWFVPVGVIVMLPVLLTLYLVSRRRRTSNRP